MASQCNSTEGEESEVLSPPPFDQPPSCVYSESLPHSIHNHTHVQISGWHVVGAALESPTTFRVWYFTPTRPIPHTNSSSKASSSAPSPLFRLHKTLPFTCASGTEASALVQCVRQGAAWHGKQSPPQVVAVINPKSGQGRYASGSAATPVNKLLQGRHCSCMQMTCVPYQGLQSLLTCIWCSE